MEVLRVQKWGNSQGIRLPKKILKDLGINIKKYCTKLVKYILIDKKSLK